MTKIARYTLRLSVSVFFQKKRSSARTTMTSMIAMIRAGSDIDIENNSSHIFYNRQSQPAA